MSDLRSQSAPLITNYINPVVGLGVDRFDHSLATIHEVGGGVHVDEGAHRVASPTNRTLKSGLGHRVRGSIVFHELDILHIVGAGGEHANSLAIIDQKSEISTPQIGVHGITLDMRSNI